jgi:hypothetical protein
MPSAVTFIIPVRHQDNAKDWSRLKANLTDTIRSISSQSSKDWNAVIVANTGANLLDLPDQFAIKWVDFPTNAIHEQGSVDKEVFYDAFRIDKGRRVLAGMYHGALGGHVMIVDDDDFVGNRLVDFVVQHRDKPGWFISNGYIWKDGGNVLYLCPNFMELCGTSHIIRSDLYNLPGDPAEVSDDFIRRTLGSHKSVAMDLSNAGTPLNALPFAGAVYRIGHLGAHSKSGSIADTFFFHKSVLLQPHRFVARLFRLRILTASRRKEYFGQ